MATGALRALATADDPQVREDMRRVWNETERTELQALVVMADGSCWLGGGVAVYHLLHWRLNHSSAPWGESGFRYKSTSYGKYHLSKYISSASDSLQYSCLLIETKSHLMEKAELYQAGMPIAEIHFFCTEMLTPEIRLNPRR